MDISTTMNSQELARTKMQVDTVNAALNNGKKVQHSLDKNDFLKLLIAQLTHQDPMQPMKDQAFIAQMAQFSTLEQMTNMSQGFSDVAHLLKSSEAMNLLGHTVDIADGDKTVTGVVDQVSGGKYPQVMVDGRFYDYSSVVHIRK